MSDDLTKVLALLPKLSKEDLKKVQEQAKVLSTLGGGSRGSRTQEHGSDDFFVLTLITDYMTRQGLDMSIPAVLRDSTAYGAFKSKVPGLMKFVKQVGNKTQQTAILSVGIELLHEDLVKIGLAATSRLMMAHIHRLPGVINREFPGYAQSGMLGFIARGAQHVRPKQDHGTVSKRRRKPVS